MTVELRGAMLIGLVFGVSVVAFLTFLQVNEKATATGPWYFGSETARWTVTEYADLECPYCRAYTPELKRWVGQNEDVKLAWHHFPLDGHGAAAVLEARLVQCAGYLGGATAYWRAIDQVLQHTRGNGVGVDKDRANLALDIEPDVFACAANNQDIAEEVDRQLAVAKSRGIAATPTLEVTDSLTGRSVRLEGPVDSTALLSVIDALAAQPLQDKEQLEQ
ncbi:thioredoxin domain-containing protein [Pseudomonas sp. zfem004]|uniref:DsbA family protein n=1 Tax=Pseudomonas sp. zfem004 TaxID=3078199 RepID=UPI0029276C17|nr:thioredoxin domain-containing protein [Pseudomonas sp. zfem004]MDU9402609.1 thioredoxin domain-containing protein [Pseudomonas sp. zfem004]